jgi:hypothetical protein
MRRAFEAEAFLEVRKKEEGISLKLSSFRREWKRV